MKTKFLKICVSIDPSIKHTKFESPMYDLIPSMIKDIMHNSRRDYGCKLLHRCARHITDMACAPKRLSGINLVRMFLNNKYHVCFEMACDVPASCKGRCYKSKLILSCDVELICNNCNCKAGRKNDDESVPENSTLKTKTRFAFINCLY